METGSDSQAYYYDYNTEETPLVDLFVLGVIKSMATSIASPMEVSKVLLQVQRLPTSSTVAGGGGGAVKETKEQQKRKSSEKGSDDEKPAGEGVLVLREGQLGTMTYLNGAVGFSSLFRGNMSNCLRSLGVTLMDDRVHDFLMDNFIHIENEDLPLAEQPAYKGILSAIGLAHGLAGLLASPLEVVQVRQIVQKRTPTPNGALVGKYDGLLSSLLTIYREEGLKGLFPAPLATFFGFLSSSVIAASSDIVLINVLNTDPIVNRYTYGFLDFLWCMLGVSLRLPLETCRRRLMVQGGMAAATQGGTKDGDKKKDNTSSATAMECLVQVNPAYLPYEGVLDCIQRIISEEGFTSLFRGMRCHLLYNTVLFSLYYATGSDLMDVEEM
eukprot:Nk52_evm86s151 gene=Nk52_evmTU86s151